MKPFSSLFSVVSFFPSAHLARRTLLATLVAVMPALATSTLAATAGAQAASTESRVATEKRIGADAKEFLYTGRIDFADPKAPVLTWPGSSIKANFTGTSLKVVLDDERGKNFYSVIVDGKKIHPFVIEAQAGEHTYTVAENLRAGAHTLEIYKRTEGEEGPTRFKGIVVSGNGKLLAPPKRPLRRIEIYGDSITSGMGNEAADNGRDDLSSEKNNYWAYGAITARNLNAELHTISQGGIGIMVSWFDFIMPNFWDQLSAVGDNDSQWDFTRWTPDVVVINLMQNDSWLIDREKRLNPIPTDAERIAAYQKFVAGVRGKYPKAHIVCAMGSMDATANNKWPDYVRAAVRDMRAQGDTNLSMIFFPYSGYDRHPRVAQHKYNAELLTAHLRKRMKW